MSHLRVSTSRERIALILLVLFVAGCSGPPEESTTGSGPPGAASRGATPFEALSRAMKNVKSFRAKLVTTSGETGATEMLMEVALPDRIRFVNEQMEIIATGKTAYLRMPDSQWQAVPLPQGLDLGNLAKLEEDLLNSSDASEVGSEVLDGVETTIYQATMKVPKPENAPANMPDSYLSKIWIAKSDSLPRRLEATSPGTSGKTVVTYYDYNAAIVINPPAQ
jgi:outer membrane lipoprotein-sorting protein